MSVAYWNAVGDTIPLEDEEGERFAYHVAEGSGVLIIVQKLDEKPWRVYKELSASGWHEVSGTRYNKNPSNAEGIDGKVSFGTGKMVVL